MWESLGPWDLLESLDSEEKGVTWVKRGEWALPVHLEMPVWLDPLDPLEKGRTD